MLIIARPPHLAWVVILWVLMGLPAAAQPALDARMRAFTRAVTAEAFVDSAAAFFPRRGEWTWTLTIHRGPRGDSVVVRRFRAEQTLEAIREGGIACESFAPRFAVRTIGPLIDRMLRDERPWRRVRGNRFVPRGASAGSPVFVDWRREDGRWVIDGYGDEAWRGPRLLGRARNDGTRDSLPAPPLTTPVPADGPHAGRIFAETGATGRAEVLYVPVAPGLEFQAYQGFGSPPCYQDPAEG